MRKSALPNIVFVFCGKTGRLRRCPKRHLTHVLGHRMLRRGGSSIANMPVSRFGDGLRRLSYGARRMFIGNVLSSVQLRRSAERSVSSNDANRALSTVAAGDGLFLAFSVANFVASNGYDFCEGPRTASLKFGLPRNYKTGLNRSIL